MSRFLVFKHGGAKWQSPGKNYEHNADFWDADEHFLMIAGGVSGVKDLGMDPAALSWDLVDQMGQHLRTRFDYWTDKGAFDRDRVYAKGVRLTNGWLGNFRRVENR